MSGTQNVDQGNRANKIQLCKPDDKYNVRLKEQKNNRVRTFWCKSRGNDPKRSHSSVNFKSNKQ